MSVLKKKIRITVNTPCATKIKLANFETGSSSRAEVVRAHLRPIFSPTSPVIKVRPDPDSNKSCNQSKT